MTLLPEFDVYAATRIAKLLGRWPLFDRMIQSAIRHNLLGGFWFAASLFLLWINAARTGNQKARRRLLTVLLGCGIAIALATLASGMISWPPPSRNPGLAHYYPDYLDPNINDNSFPSQSTAAYTAVAAGIFTLNRLGGWGLLLAVVALVALPRAYVGGHYLTDLVVGGALGLGGFLAARYLLETWLVPRIDQAFEDRGWLRAVGELVVFGCVLEVAVEFRELVWIKDSLSYFLR